MTVLWGSQCEKYHILSWFLLGRVRCCYFECAQYRFFFKKFSLNLIGAHLIFKAQQMDDNFSAMIHGSTCPICAHMQFIMSSVQCIVWICACFHGGHYLLVCCWSRFLNFGCCDVCMVVSIFNKMHTRKLIECVADAPNWYDHAIAKIKVILMRLLLFSEQQQQQQQ